MPSFDIYLCKKIVVTIEADTFEEAREAAINDTDGFDGAWDRAENLAEHEPE